MRLGRPPLYPWRKMKVGDTFVFRQPSLRGGRQAACQMSVELGRSFKVTKLVTGKVVCERVR
jgi:hypothetical protein